MKVTTVVLLVLTALANAAAIAGAGDPPLPPKPSSLVPHPSAPGHVYGAPIQGQILHKHLRKKPSTARTPIS
jgi:hypothetical protein